MTEPSLLVMCVIAFFAVMVLLSVLGGVIRLLMALFPGEEPGSDATLIAAIHSAAAAAFPGTRVTKIEETR